MELDLLGDLLSAALDFLDSGFKPNLIVHDETTSDDLPAKHMFYERDGERGGRWFMRAESIPGDLSIKAIAVDLDGLYLETSPLDGIKANEAIAEEMLAFTYNAHSRQFIDMHTDRVLISLSKPVKTAEGLGSRCLWTLLFKDAQDRRRQVAVKVIDLMYSRCCFEPDESEQSVSEPTSQQMVQRMQLDLHQRLAVEQRPFLSLRINQQVTASTRLRAELQGIFYLEKMLLTMNPEEQLKFVVEYMTQYGQARIKSLSLFTITRRIKREVPQLTWKQSLKLARKFSKPHSHTG